MDKINQTFCHIFCRAVYEHYPKYFQNKSLLKGTVRFIGCLLITSSQRVIKRILNPNSQNTLLYISCYIRCVCVCVCSNFRSTLAQLSTHQRLQLPPFFLLPPYISPAGSLDSQHYSTKTPDDGGHVHRSLPQSGR